MIAPATFPSNRMNDISVCRATQADRPTLARLLADAFDGEPFADWFVRRDAHRAERFLRFFDVYWRLAMPHGQVYTTQERRGAALWIPPDRWKASLWDELLYLPDVLRITSARPLWARADAVRFAD